WSELHSTLTSPTILEKIVVVACKIKPLDLLTYHRPPRDEETPNHNYGVWSLE
uniref:Uncharacterized protein n=1 Tax=Cannabis sativa TaxID=3483 RepID=A0A803PTD4_CANSA